MDDKMNHRTYHRSKTVAVFSCARWRFLGLRDGWSI